MTLTFNIWLCLDVGLCIYHSWSWASWVCRFVLYIRGEKFSVIISSNFFCFFFFRDSHYTYVVVLNGVLHFSEVLFIFLHFFFLFILHNIYQFIFKLLILFAIAQINSWGPLVNCFIPIIVFCNSTIFSWLFVIFIFYWYFLCEKI